LWGPDNKRNQSSKQGEQEEKKEKKKEAQTEGCGWDVSSGSGDDCSGKGFENEVSCIEEEAEDNDEEERNQLLRGWTDSETG
jgi:hypothetical protein